jgi:hypothetical protein
MHFLVPWMLFGALSAGIPVALHLLRKSKPTVVRWAPMEFLRKSLKETSKKIRLRDLILLLLRMTILILAALALARPSTLSLFGSGPVDAVILIDNSQSMSTLEGQTSRLDMALTSAKQLLGNLPTGSKARIISLTDHTVELSYNNSNESDAIASALFQIKPTDRSSNFYQGFANAIDLLKTSSFSQRKIFFFSDMQRPGWQNESSSFKTLVQNMPSSISIHMIRHGSDVDSNIQILDFQPTAGIILANQRQTWGLTVRNRGIKPATGIKTTLGLASDFDTAESAVIEKLDAGEERSITIDLLIPEDGHQIVKAVAGNDRFSRDNQKEKIVLARKKLQVLIVGAKSEIDANRDNTFFLYHALRSGSSDSSNSGIEVKVASGRGATPDTLDETDIVFMVDPMLAGSDSVSDGFMEKLENWVSVGNTLVYFAGSNYAAVSDSNIKNAGKFLPTTNPTPNLVPSTIATENFPPVGWFNRFRSAPLNLINQSEFRKRVTFETSKDYQTSALGYFSDNQPLAEMKQLRAGFITLLPWVPDLSYSDLPLRPSFVPFIQTLLSRILDTLNDAKNPLISREMSLRLQPQDLIGGEKYKWVSPTGMALAASMEKSVDEVVFRGEFLTPDAGIWKLETSPPSNSNTNTKNLIAVQASNEEGAELNPLQESEIDEILGKNVSHQNNTGEASITGSTGELTNLLLYLLLLFFVFEMFFAWWCGQPL